MYRRDMARTGEKLFKRRHLALYLVVAFGAVIAGLDRGPLFGSPGLEAVFEWFWIAVAIAATVFRFMAKGFAALGTSGPEREAAKAATLNTTGPYSIVRNPLYVGRILIYSAIGFLSGEWAYGVVVFFLSFLHFERIIAYEEQFLSAKFGKAYVDWAARTPALLPKPSLWSSPTHPFWWRRAFRRESNKGIALFATIIAYHVILDHGATGVWAIDPILLNTLYVLIVARLVMVWLVFFTKYFENIH